MRISDWSSDVCSSDLVDAYRESVSLQCTEAVIVRHPPSCGEMIQRRFLGSVRILCGRAVSRSARSLQSKYQTMENHTHSLCSRMWRAASTGKSGERAGWYERDSECEYRGAVCT